MSETVPDPNDLHWHIRLRRILVEYFDEDELETLCFDLRVDFEDLKGRTKPRKRLRSLPTWRGWSRLTN